MQYIIMPGTRRCLSWFCRPVILSERKSSPSGQELPGIEGPGPDAAAIAAALIADYGSPERNVIVPRDAQDMATARYSIT